MTTTQLLSDASRQLMSRPPDEHFSSLNDLRTAARKDMENSYTIELNIKLANIKANLGGTNFILSAPDIPVGYSFNNYTFTKLCQYAGTRKDFVADRLSPDTAAKALTEALSRGNDEVVSLLIGTTTTSNLTTTPETIRAITTPSYCRVWDSEMLTEVHEWIAPNGFEPARPTINTNAQRNNIMGNNKPALFRGDRDSFIFFMTDKTDEGHGGRPVRRGILCGNSEVGKRSLWTKRFIFDDMCANFLIWGATNIEETRIRHRGNDNASLIRRFRDELRRVVPEVVEEELNILREANKVIFAATPELAQARLTKSFGLSKELSRRVLEAASLAENEGLNPYTYAWVGNGVTSLAKNFSNADMIVKLAEIGGNIFLESVK